MISDALDALFGSGPHGPVMYVVDAVLLAFILACPALTLGESRKVRDGWMGESGFRVFAKKKFTGTRAEFLARYRRSLTTWGWSLTALGGVLLMLDVLDVLDGEPVRIMTMLITLVLLIWGLVCLWSRRQLNSPPHEPAADRGPETASA